MQGWTAVCGLGLFLALTTSWPTAALAQDGASTRSPASGQQLDDRPMFTSLVNGSVWPQHKKERETEFEASVVIQVDSDAAATQIGSPAVALLTTSALVEQAARKATGIERAKVRESLQVIATGAALKMTRLEVRLLKTPGVEWKDGDAEKVILALVDGLRAALNQSATAAARLAEEAAAQRAQEVAALNQKMDELRKEQQEVRQKLADIPPQFMDRLSAARNVVNELRNVEQQLRMNEEQLATRNPAASELLSEWEELVKLREEKLKQLKDDNRPAAEIRDAEIQLAEARAKLASTQAGTDRFSRSDVAEIARLKSRIEQGKRQQADLQALADKLRSPEWQNLFDRQQQLSATEETLRNELMMTRSRTDQFRRQPTARFIVTILDGRE